MNITGDHKYNYMFLFKSISGLQSHLAEVRGMSKAIGFVPTMGALHDGHTSLITRSIESGNYTVVSIYVNPTQFNESDDLAKYPRPISDDLVKLNRLGVDVVFLPTDEEIYPDGTQTAPDVPLGHLGNTLEAAFRPGHFEGVVQVMDRLLRIVRPDILFMGNKDLQQIAVVRKLIEFANFKCKLVGLPIIREPHGLARSSRNERLTPADREAAAVIYNTLKETYQNYHELTFSQLKQAALKRLSIPPFRPEYFEFVRTDTMKILDARPDDPIPVSVVTAVWCRDVRLIDNMEMSGSE